MRSWRAPFLTLVALGSAAGCRMYEWKDEPNIRPAVAAGVDAAIADLDSYWVDDRTIACRALGQLALSARARGDHEQADRIATKLMEHFVTEDAHQVRSVILALALRDLGKDHEGIQKFVMDRLAADELPVAAANTLAVLQPPGTFEAIRDAIARANPERRYELLLALWLLGDPRAGVVFAEQLRTIDRDWPDRIHNMDKAQYRKVLEGRARTLPRATR